LKRTEIVATGSVTPPLQAMTATAAEHPVAGFSWTATPPLLRTLRAKVRGKSATFQKSLAA